ncbi:hypothetical protein SDC9_45763 [bioreactor metagenome]|uniref:Uncharacterized protein n=1 Tax=bioreactor metagenome TaxID=1076179 RepID=A0A644W6Z3_9ZZZZ
MRETTVRCPYCDNYLYDYSGFDQEPALICNNVNFSRITGKYYMSKVQFI